MVDDVIKNQNINSTAKSSGADILNNDKGPWGKRPGASGDDNKPQSPWGNGQQRPNSGGQGKSEIDIIMDGLNKFFESFGGGNGTGNKGGKKPAGGSGGSPVRFFAMILMGVAILWLASGFYRVQPEEDAVVLRFGEWNRTKVDPGLGYHLPWPVEKLDKINVEFQRRVEVGFRGNTSSRSSTSVSAGNDIPEESLMLTGDENIIDIDFVVVWSVKDAREILYNIRDAEGTIKKVAESAMREVIGQTEIQTALTKGRTLIETRTRDLMQEMLNDYKAGVAIEAIQLQKVDPPSSVVDAFNEVQRARADRERLRNEAEAYRNDIIPRARGNAEKLIQDSEAYRELVINQAEGDANRFNSVLKAYSVAKDVTEQRLYLETLEEIFANTPKVIVDSEIGGQGIVPYLPLNELNKKTTSTTKSTATDKK